MTIALRALTDNEIAALDQVPPLTGAPLGFPDPSLFVPLGQWLAALYAQATGSTPGAGSFTTLGVLGPLTGGAVSDPLAIELLQEDTGSVSDPGMTIASSEAYTGSQPILSILNDSSKLVDFTPAGMDFVAGNVVFTKSANHTLTLATSTTVGGTNGLLSFAGGQSGPADASTPGGAGSNVSIVGSTGGVGSALQVAGAGGDVFLTGGTSGSDGGGGGANGGGAYVDAGNGISPGVNGNVYLGNARAVEVNIGRSAGKLGFYGNLTPVVQPSSVGQTAGFTAGAGAAVLVDSTFTGGSGTKAYTVGDLVKHLKALGLLAAS